MLRTDKEGAKMYKSAYLAILRGAGQRLNDECFGHPEPWKAEGIAKEVFAMCLGCGSPELADAVFCAANAKQLTLIDLATIERGYEALDSTPVRQLTG